MPLIRSMLKNFRNDPFLSRSKTEQQTATLLPMLIGSLVLIVVCMIGVMIFVRGA